MPGRFTTAPTTALDPARSNNTKTTRSAPHSPPETVLTMPTMAT